MPHMSIKLTSRGEFSVRVYNADKSYTQSFIKTSDELFDFIDRLYGYKEAK
ncbi:MULTISPECIES: hypothetical protein [unclassified Beijerinckia]|uniref:hypothetical protein n=1 Tax=unclassified Beijerinckia TaxID=2638183 RepID=UPI00089BDDE9|nr:MULTISPECIES: hypothetical protein [unclassified Beijerinckia]MDH7796456.1 hypothetical protein [Beijerinckia sp. GAS462]SEC45866.1 hypothetical protein SAMN05443249_2738 [Beijerinckia sp. 28-YEA-48]